MLGYAGMALKNLQDIPGNVLRGRRPLLYCLWLNAAEEGMPKTVTKERQTNIKKQTKKGRTRERMQTKTNRKTWSENSETNVYKVCSLKIIPHPLISSPSSPMSQGKWTDSRFKWLKILAWIPGCSVPASEKLGFIHIYTVPLNGWDDTRSISNGSKRRAGWRWIHIPGDPEVCWGAWSGQGTRRSRQKRRKQANVAKIDRRVNIAMAAGPLPQGQQRKPLTATNFKTLRFYCFEMFWVSKVQRSVKSGCEMRAQHWTASISLALPSGELT